jgi:hypothetical protein
MYAQFEEKQYEDALKIELVDKTSIYTPGQVFENDIGIDAALFSKNLIFWKLWPFGSHFPSGDSLNAELWDILEENLKTNQFPKFKCNLFVQFKRPEYISSSRGKEYSFWNKPYFRYNIKTNQQDALCKLERNISSNSIVVYACSAFWEFDDLWNFKANSQLVEKSNFAKPRDLNNHQTYTYVSDGKDGKAFSQPEDINGIDIIECIESKFKSAENFENNADFIYSIDRSIMEVVEKLDKDYKMAFYSVSEKIKSPNNKLAKSIQNLAIFNHITNTNWFIVYEK